MKTLQFESDGYRIEFDLGKGEADQARVYPGEEKSTEERKEKMNEKARENRLRRRALKLGLLLHKSRSETWNIDDQLGYMIVDQAGNFVVFGSRFELDLDDVEESLNEYKSTEEE